MFWENAKKESQDKNIESNDYDINVEVARHNYEAYQNDLRQRQQNLIKKWCEEIRKASSKGKKYILTDNFVVDGNDKDKILYLISGDVAYDFPSDASVQYFYQYFDERGFKVVLIKYPNNNICCLKIIWVPSNE